MNISISKFVGVAACAALFAQPVYAGCSGNTDLILNSSAAVAAITPIPGSKYASAALKLGALFSCKENGEVQALQIADVIDLIRDELDEQAFNTAKDDLNEIERRLRKLYRDLAGNGETIDGVPTDIYDFKNAIIGSLTQEQMAFIRDEVNEIVALIDDTETDLSDRLVTPNNSRIEYNLSVALLLANYRIALFNLLRDAESVENYTDLVNTSLKKWLGSGTEVGILNGYKNESDRLSDILITSSSDSATHKVWADARLKRAGKTLKYYREECDPELAPGFDSSSCKESILKSSVEYRATQDLKAILAKLDLQEDTHLALVQAKAEALRNNPYANLEEVAPKNMPLVEFVNAHPNAKNRCIFVKGGGVNPISGSIVQAATRLRSCDSVLNRQHFTLEDTGQIRSAIGDLCLEASNSESKVFLRKCSSSVKQVWERDGNRFQVQYGGQTHCLSPRPDHISKTDETLRHVACSSKVEQQWYVFSPLQNKALPAGVEPITAYSHDPETGELVVNEYFGVKADPHYCLGMGTYNSDIGRQEPALEACDRYNSKVQWAQDELGQFRPLSNPTQVIAGVGPYKPLILADESEVGIGPRYDRNDIGNGAVTFQRKSDSTRFLHSETAEEGAYVFSNDNIIFDINGDPSDVAQWKHFNDGKWAD